MSEARRREDPEALGARLDQLRLPEPGAPRRRRGPRIALGAAALLLIALGLARVLHPPVLEVQLARAEPVTEVSGQPIPVLSGTGYLVPAQPVIAVGSRVPGRIARYRVDEGDRVVLGQPLVELDARTYRAAADQADASLASARARLRLAESELARVRGLHAAAVAAANELDVRESEAATARAGVRELEAALERARTDLEDTLIRAPTAGVVLETLKQPGEVAVPGGFSGSGDLLRLANLEEIRAELDVNEADLAHVFLGQAAQVVPDAYPDLTWQGEVVELSPQIDRQKGTRQVEVRLLEPDPRLLPDMSARVVFLAALEAGDGAAPASGVVIPRSALRRDPDGRFFVWVEQAGRARRVAVEPGDALGERLVIRSGLVAGASVITGAPPEREDQRVRAAP